MFLDVAPVVGHRSPSECGGQTDHRWAVSNPGLLLEVYQSQAPHHLGGEVAFLRAECGASREGDAFGAVDGVAVSIRGDEGRVARSLDVLSDLRQREIPGYGRPSRGAGGAVLRVRHAARR